MIQRAHLTARQPDIWIVLLALCFITPLMFTGPVQGEAVATTRVYGGVVDYATQQPIPAVHIIFWNNEMDIVAVAETDVLGSYEVSVGRGSYQVYAYVNRSSTSGFDYVPVYRQFSAEGEALNLSFSLLPGASVTAAGSFRPFDFLPDVKRVVFTVMDFSGLVSQTGSVTVYGEGLLVNQLLNLSGRTVLVPSNALVKVKVDVFYVDGMTRHFTIDRDGGYLILTQGAQLVVDVKNFMIRAEYELEYVSERLEKVSAQLDELAAAGLPALKNYYRSALDRCRKLLYNTGSALAIDDYSGAYSYIVEIYNRLEEIEIRISYLHVSLNDFDSIKSFLLSVQNWLNETEGFGFYVGYERAQLLRAENLMESAHSAMVEGNDFRAVADLSEAQLILLNIEDSLASMYMNATSSVFFITPFLGFTAVILVSLLVDNLRRRLVFSLAVYGLLLGSIYPLLQSGYTLLMKEEYSTIFVSFPLLVISSFLVPLFILYGLPRLFGGRPSRYGLCFISAVAAAFSISARNLRRRRARTLSLTAILLISVFGFITLTNFSFEYGLFTRQLPGQPPSEGLLIRKYIEKSHMPFEPLEPTICEQLKERPEVTMVVPMIENRPRAHRAEYTLPPLANLRVPASGLTFDVEGLLGIYPSLEVNVTKIDGITVEGRFLRDEDLNGILISQEAAEKLQVEPNDTLELYGQSFIVTGIFDSKRLEALRDLDGEPLVPQLVVIYSLGGPLDYVTKYVPSKNVVIVHGETALSLPGTVISRVAVKTRYPDDMEALARLAVFNWPDVEAFYPLFGRVYQMRVGLYRLESGFGSTIVPLVIVVLNVGIAMLGEVYERKREALAMSCVGLNPLHISAVFVAEALILGVVAGTLGYIFGIGSYRLMALFPFSFGVRQKVEAIWTVLALCFSIFAAILGSLLPATKASMIATPSLTRRWIMAWPESSGEPWVIDIPLEVHEEDVVGFFFYMSQRLNNWQSMSEWFQDVLIRGAEPPDISFFFVHRWEDERVHTKNRLLPVKSSRPHYYTFQLVSRTRLGTISGEDERQIRITANIIRRLILQYSHERSLIEKH